MAKIGGYRTASRAAGMTEGVRRVSVGGGRRKQKALSGDGAAGVTSIGQSRR